MAVMLLFTSIAHFAFNKGMAMMIPGFIPFKSGVVYFTGLIEIAAAVGLLIPGMHYTAGILTVIFFIFILPSNILAAKQKINLEKANYDGKGPSYLWFRVPLQVFFTGWVLWFAVVH
jgi:uncharacterized membrane protein